MNCEVSDLRAKRDKLKKEIENDRVKTSIKALEHRELELMIELEEIKGRIKTLKEQIKGD